MLLVGGVKYERLRAVAGLVGYGESEVKRALMATAYTGNIEAVKQHLVASMDVNVKDTGFFRMTPLDYAFFRSQDDRLLKSRVAVGNAVSHGAIIDHVEITIKECGGNDTFQNLGQQIPSHRRLCGWRRVEAPSKKSYDQQRKRYVSCECFPGHALVHDPFPFGGSNAVGTRSRSDNAEESGRAIDGQGQWAKNIDAHVFPDWRA